MFVWMPLKDHYMPTNQNSELFPADDKDFLGKSDVKTSMKEKQTKKLTI